MADFNITVDTLPMAATMESVRGQVQNVNGAVIAMQSAVIEAERSASQQICRNVDNGFFILMRSQLSQKIAACSSTMSSKLMLMQKFSMDIQHIQEVMQDDYNRICRRYMKQFNALDKALETRIRELDKSAMEIGELKRSIASRHKNDAAAVILYSEDTQFTAQKAVEARVKVKSSRAISAMKEDVLGSRRYTESVEHILKDGAQGEIAENFVPVIVAETDSMFDSSTSLRNVYAPDAAVNSPSTASAMTQAVHNSCEEFKWKKLSDDESQKIKSSFAKLCSESNIDGRVLNEMMRLFNASEPECAECGDYADCGGEQGVSQ